MKLEHLFDSQYRFTEKAELVDKSTGKQAAHGQHFGAGMGQVVGARLTGALSWENAPYLRKDGVLTPNMRGLITTSDGARIRYEALGYSLPPEASAPSMRRFLTTIRFHSTNERYRWLNVVQGFEEGIIYLSTFHCKTRVFQGIHDFEPEQ